MSIVPEAIWAAAPSTVRGRPTPLSSDSKGERIVYASSKSIFVRSIDHPEVSKQYTQHAAKTTVARFSPSGFYVASGDESGLVRVWDSVGAENTKGEYAIISGPITDIAWDGDSQRIIAVGDGRERFGHCITADSGNSVGEISGHSSQINCVSIRQQRPLRAATGSNDKSMGFFTGAPFKFADSARGNHDNYIYGTQFSPDGALLVSVGGDRKIWLYDGKTGATLKQIGQGEHKGSIFGVSWSPDSKNFVTCSGDQTVKVWDVEAEKCIKTWNLGGSGSANFLNQQVGVTWPAGRSDGLIISLDLAGNLNYLNLNKDAPIRVVRGHQSAITAATASAQSQTLWTGSSQGLILAWNLNKGSAEVVDGEAHSNLVSGLTESSSEGRVYSAGWDDTLRILDSAQNSYVGSSIKTAGQPKGVAGVTIGGRSHVLVATSAGVSIYTDGAEVGKQKLSSAPTCIAALDETVAVGREDKKVSIFRAASPSAFSEIAELNDATAPISALAFSSNGTHLAAGTANGKIYAYSNASGEWKLETSRWSAHTARVTSIAWSSNTQHVVSGALDTNVFVWSLKDPGKRVKANNAHKEGVANVLWVNASTIVSVGADAAVKAWKVANI